MTILVIKRSQAGTDFLSPCALKCSISNSSHAHNVSIGMPIQNLDAAYLFRYADTNECSDGVDDCHETLGLCSNTQGSFTCACISGYAGDGTSCSGTSHFLDKALLPRLLRCLNRGLTDRQSFQGFFCIKMQSIFFCKFCQMANKEHVYRFMFFQMWTNA